MREYLPILFLNCVFLFAGCGVLRELSRELAPAVLESVQKAGPPPSVPVDYSALASYALNVALGTWAAYERRRRSN